LEAEVVFPLLLFMLFGEFFVFFCELASARSLGAMFLASCRRLSKVGRVVEANDFTSGSFADCDSFLKVLSCGFGVARASWGNQRQQRVCYNC
jgi:hypothetical protein